MTNFFCLAAVKLKKYFADFENSCRGIFAGFISSSLLVLCFKALDAVEVRKKILTFQTKQGS